MPAFPHAVKIVEVAPRDGFQNESQIIPTAFKIDFINALSHTGLKTIEVTSFVPPKWIPQFADNKEVFEGIHKLPGIAYPVLVPNMQGLEQAIQVGVKEIALLTTPSEKFSKKNTNTSVKESLHNMRHMVEVAKKEGLFIRVYISCVLGCPYEGEIVPEKVVRMAENLLEMGCDEISLGDTIGVGTPLKTRHLLEQILKVIPASVLAVHFHDTYNQALTNIYIALEHGITIIDSTVAGFGGCPYAKGASGNVATEDVVYMLHGMGIKTGIDFEKLLLCGRMIADYLKVSPQSKVNRALTSLF